MAIVALPGQLQNAQTGNADSTNTGQRAYEVQRQLVLRITSTIGATPTVTVKIQGSVDGTTFYNIPYSPIATAPNGWVATNLTITTAVTAYYVLMPGQSWNYLRLNMSANTNVTLTSDVF